MSHSDTLLNLAWFIPLFPFLAFVAIPLGVYRNRKLSHGLVIGAIATAFVLSQIVFWRAVTLPVGGGEHAYRSETIRWLVAGQKVFGLGVWVDPATAVMLFMVPLVCMMIFIYSVGYMNFGTPQEDPRYSRFFDYLALFATGMLGMVVFDNLLAFFIFWEIMGTCSYLLIGFWYEKNYPDPDKITPRQAGLKAFLVTKVGDLFFVLGLVLLYAEVGSLAYRDIFSPENLEHLATVGFLGTGFPVAAVIALLLFGGTVGKSAQFPLHVWLPDAMEGPTPVSALIHAATMVSAGVFLVVRCFPIFTAVGEHLEPIHMTVVMAIGAFTALFASIMAVAQDDIKGVLAFSTISQLGYMVAALGLGGIAVKQGYSAVGPYVAGTFHLITHAFFKALLFLSSGSVIHGVEHGHHHVHEHAHGHGEAPAGEAWFNPNDMKNMGGLGKRMPRTALAFTAGALALAGFPVLTAGFWSKDEILAQAYRWQPVVFWVLAAAAGLTAFYTARQLCLTFLGEPRTGAARHAPESVDSMTVPLIILAVFAISLGWVGIPDNILNLDLPRALGVDHINWFHHFVGSTIEGGHGEAEHALRVAGHLSEVVETFDPRPMTIGTAFGLLGLLAGWLVYGRRPLRAGQMDPVEALMRRLWLGWLYDAMRNRFYFDDLYRVLFVQASILISKGFAWFDSTVLDGAVNGAGWLGRTLSNVSYRYVDVAIIDAFVNFVGWLGEAIARVDRWFDVNVVNGAVDLTGDMTTRVGKWLRRTQSGQVQSYVWIALLAITTLIGMYLLVAW